MNDQGILHNIRILDFTRVLAGPYATRLLGDFGAEVIKVQSPTRPEDEDAFTRGYYNTWNRNKLGITLNLNKPEGVALVKKLASISDAVVENFTPRVMANWGLDYANLKKVKPDIIMVSMSVMGQKSSHKDYAGYGPTVQALSGMTALTSFGRLPIGPGFAYADHIAGLYASLELLGALENRRRTGEGQHIDISEVAVMKGLLKEKDTPTVSPYGVYLCRDNRWCALAVFSAEEWRGLKRALGNPARVEEIRFETPQGWRVNGEEIDRLITAWTRENTAEEVMSRMQENGVTAGIVQDAADLARDPQLQARGFFVESGVFTDASDKDETRRGGVQTEGAGTRAGQRLRLWQVIGLK